MATAGLAKAGLAKAGFEILRAPREALMRTLSFGGQLAVVEAFFGHSVWATR